MHLVRTGRGRHPAVREDVLVNWTTPTAAAPMASTQIDQEQRPRAARARQPP